MKHDVSNQRLMSRWSAGKLPLQIRSGKPPVVLVFEVSLPEIAGREKLACLEDTIQASFQPPMT